jgi:hypothetical protein
MMPETHDEYLGDGVYASFDGYHILLDLRGQDDSTRIALEPPVFEALLRYKTKMDRIAAVCEECASD